MKDKFDNFKRFVKYNPAFRVYIAGVLVGTGVTLLVTSKSRPRQVFIQVSPEDIKKILDRDFAGVALLPKNPSAIFLYTQDVPFKK